MNGAFRERVLENRKSWQHQTTLGSWPAGSVEDQAGAPTATENVGRLLLNRKSPFTCDG